MPEETEWLKSSFCADGQCVEVRKQGDVVVVRDGKNPAERNLEFTGADWTTFLDLIQDGRLPLAR